jgi:hypothetical protein
MRRTRAVVVRVSPTSAVVNRVILSSAKFKAYKKKKKKKNGATDRATYDSAHIKIRFCGYKKPKVID